MNKSNIPQSERIKIFLNEYYFGYGVYYSILRIVAGPLILLMGLNMYLNGSTKFGVSYSGFMIFFGLYYILKPMITILIQKSWFKKFDLIYQIEPEKIIIKSGNSKSELDYSELNKVQKRKTYFALKMKSKQGIYLLIKHLEPTEIEILNKLVKK